MKFYHYTIADRLVKILIDGYIKIMPESSKTSEDELCLAWVTSSPEWEKTAFYGYPQDVLEQAGKIRITLTKKYPSHKIYSNNIDNVKMLELSAIAEGTNINDWGVSLKPIPITHFEKIELWRNKQWEEVPFIKDKHDSKMD